MQRIHRKTRNKMFAHIEASLKSGESNRHYCEQHGIAPATFYYWYKRYKEEHSEKSTENNSGGFIPINIQSEEPVSEADHNHLSSQLHFLFPSGVQVMCPDTVNLQVLKSLINP